MISLICEGLRVLPSRLASIKGRKFIVRQWSVVCSHLAGNSYRSSLATDHGLSLKLLRRNRRIVPAETERIVDDRLDLDLPRGVRYVIQIQIRIGHGIIDRGRHGIGLE